MTNPDPLPLDVGAPVAGAVRALSELADPVFAAALVGPGVAIEPAPGRQEALAPVDGDLVKLLPHAFVVATAGGTRGVLVHLGIDTVTLGGAGFELLAEAGARVARGTPIVRWDPAEVRAQGLAASCPVIALDATADAIEVTGEAAVTPLAMLFTWT